MHFGKKQVHEKLIRTGSAETRQKNRFLMFLVAVLVGLFVTVVFAAGFLAIGAFNEILKNTPEVTSLDDIEPNQKKSIVYAADGSIMQELVVSGSNRIPAKYEEIPKDLINAIVAIEDARFFEHNGVDVKGVLRAVVVGLTSGKLSEGASTLTQQLIKNNIFDGGFETNVGDRITRKLQEQYLALKVEQQVDKKTILTNYLNTINFGANSLGVKVAALRYFNKDVSELDLAECTVIVATTSSPSRYNPITHPDKNQVRRLIILKKMLEEGMITEEEKREASSEDVYKRVQENSESRVQHAFSYFTDTVFEDVLDRLQTELGYTDTQASNLLYSGGLRIYTTMDPDVQEAIDAEVNNEANYVVTANGQEVHYLEYSLSCKIGIRTLSGNDYYFDETNVLNYFRDVVGLTDFDNTFTTRESLQNAVNAFKTFMLNETDGEIISESVYAIIEPQTSVVVMDQRTGYVLGISGGRGDKDEMGSRILNRATQSTRQPGSTFKVISAYAPAIDLKGATLGTTYYDSEYLVDGRAISNWWGSSYMGYSNIRQGIMASMNIVAVKCLENTVSEMLAYDYVKSFGISTLVPKDRSPVFVLGGLTYGVTNLEMTAAYATIANNGIYTTPVFWTKVTDSDGNVLLQNEQVQKTVLRPETAKLLTSAMEDSVTPQWMVFPRESVGATNTPCQVPDMHIAGKSGTTSDANDLWFIGYSPYYTMGIWCGYDSNKAYGESPGYHKVIWQKIMARISEGLTDRSFDYSGLVQANICSKSGLLAREGICSDCGDPDCHVYTEYFTPNTVPTEYCNRHAEFSVCTESGLLSNEFCPEETVEKRIYLTLDRADRDDKCLTGDLLFTMPEEMVNSSCYQHDETTTTENESEEEEETSASSRWIR